MGCYTRAFFKEFKRIVVRDMEEMNMFHDASGTKTWVVIAFNGRFEVSKYVARRVLKSDTRNTYSWQGNVCEVLTWSTEDFNPEDKQWNKPE